MQNYSSLSIETHLFFARIMKEHALFLEAGFPCKNQDWIERADWFKQQFEDLLCEVVNLADGNISDSILSSDELVTRFTLPAERSTERLSGISINSQITNQQQQIRPGCLCQGNRGLQRTIHKLNARSIQLLNGLIAFKESILREVANCTLFNANYPLLIRHILREAELYRATVSELMQRGCLSSQSQLQLETFWNQIMMEHALFIRGLLDPCEETLITTAHEFATDFCELLELAKQQDCMATDALTRKSLEETLRLRDFKAAGAEGVLNGTIASILLPLLADHVLREANHYIRILECSHNIREV